MPISPRKLQSAQRLLLACLAGTSLAAPAGAADLTARQVTELLYKAPFGSKPELASKDLSNLDLAGLDFKSARLAGSDLYGADLTGANLAGADLKGARLDRATL